MPYIFFDSNNSDSFRLVKDDSYEPKIKLKEFVDWLESKIDNLRTRLATIEINGSLLVLDEKKKINKNIDKLQDKAEDMKNNILRDINVTKKKLEKLVENTEKDIKKIASEIASLSKR